MSWEENFLQAPNQMEQIDIENILLNLVQDDIIGAGRDGVILHHNSQALKVFYGNICSQSRSTISYLLQISCKGSFISKNSLKREHKVKDVAAIVQKNLQLQAFLEKNNSPFQVAPITSIAIYNELHAGYCMPYYDGSFTSINNLSRTLQDYIEMIEQKTGIILDKFGNNVLRDKSNLILLDII